MWNPLNWIMKAGSSLGSNFWNLMTAALTPGLFWLAGKSEAAGKVLVNLPWLGETSLPFPENWYAPVLLLLAALLAEFIELGSYEALPKPRNVGFALGFNLATIIVGVLILVHTSGVMSFTAMLLPVWFLGFGMFAGMMLAKTDWQRASMSVDKA